RPTRHHHQRTRQQDRPYHRDSAGREDQRPRPHGDVQANYRKQSRWWLEESDREAPANNVMKLIARSAGRGTRAGCEMPEGFLKDSSPGDHKQQSRVSIEFIFSSYGKIL